MEVALLWSSLASAAIGERGQVEEICAIIAGSLDTGKEYVGRMNALKVIGEISAIDVERKDMCREIVSKHAQDRDHLGLEVRVKKGREDRRRKSRGYVGIPRKSTRLIKDLFRKSLEWVFL